MYHSGSTGRLSIGEVNPVEVGRMRNWSYQINQAVLDTTTLEDLDATVVPGTRSLSGSGSLYYYSDRTPGAVSNAAGLIRLIQPDAATQATEVLFELMAASGKQIAFRGYLTSFAMTCAVGEVVSAEIQFTGSGPLTQIAL
jgi:hypothetical protein